jgi:ribonuclease VapC
VIVVDTSALIAILRNEPERQQYLEVIADDDNPLISVVSILEATMVASRALQDGAADAVNAFVSELGLRAVPVTIGQVELAQAAFFAHGKGRGGKAQLNFGDCLVYGLAKWCDAPVLFKGVDFSGADIAPAIVANR